MIFDNSEFDAFNEEDIVSTLNQKRVEILNVLQKRIEEAKDNLEHNENKEYYNNLLISLSCLNELSDVEKIRLEDLTISEDELIQKINEIRALSLPESQSSISAKYEAEDIKNIKEVKKEEKSNSNIELDDNSF